jgi:hypothetical protein
MQTHEWETGSTGALSTIVLPRCLDRSSVPAPHVFSRATCVVVLFTAQLFGRALPRTSLRASGAS